MASGRVVAVVGVTGAVGQTTLRLLEERKFPVKELRAFASERSVGKHMTFKGEAIRVERLHADAFRGVEFALFSAGSAQSREWAPRAVAGRGGGHRQVERLPDGPDGAAGGAGDQR